MKIDPTDKLNRGIGSSPMKSNEAPQGPAFADVLKKTAGGNASEQVARVSGVRPVMRPMVTDPGKEIYRSTEQMLNTLERYQNMLADPHVDLRSIAPTVQQIKKQIDAMSPLMNQDIVGGQIKQVAQEALQIVSKEIARYDGGVYVD